MSPALFGSLGDGELNIRLANISKHLLFIYDALYMVFNMSLLVRVCVCV